MPRQVNHDAYDISELGANLNQPEQEQKKILKKRREKRSSKVNNGDRPMAVRSNSTPNLTTKKEKMKLAENKGAGCNKQSGSPSLVKSAPRRKSESSLLPMMSSSRSSRRNLALSNAAILLELLGDDEKEELLKKEETKKKAKQRRIGGTPTPENTVDGLFLTTTESKTMLLAPIKWMPKPHSQSSKPEEEAVALAEKRKALKRSSFMARPSFDKVKSEAGLKSPGISRERSSFMERPILDRTKSEASLRGSFMKRPSLQRVNSEYTRMTMQLTSKSGVY